MKISTLSFIIVCALLLCSCKSAKKTVQSDTPILLEEKSPVEIVVRTEKVKPIDQSDRTMSGYYVIIGSFRSLDNAKNYHADMVKRGFTAEILENEAGLYRISAGGYDEESAARAKIAEIRATYEEHEDVWLLVRQ